VGDVEKGVLPPSTMVGKKKSARSINGMAIGGLKKISGFLRPIRFSL